MNNQEIVEIVYRQYDVKGLIKKLIKDSSVDDSCDDLEQYIYLVLLEMDNEKLNRLYNNNELRKLISQIIKNQRNYYRSVYNLEYKLRSDDTVVDCEDENEYDMVIDFFYYELERVPFGTTGLTNDEMRRIFGYEVFKYYIKHNISMGVVAKRLNMKKSTTRNFILEAKKNLRKAYDTEYNNFVNNVIVMGNFNKRF